MFKFRTFIILAVCLKISHSQEEILLQWPKQYSVKILETSFVTGISHTMDVWYDSECGFSRIDYYNGSVRKYYDSGNSTLYEVHPETTENETNKLVCRIKWNINSTFEETLILPNIYLENFEYISTENIAGEDVNKYQYNAYSYTDHSDQRFTLWATYSYKIESWIPVKYEQLEYKQWVGSLENHFKWEFYDFVNDVDHDLFNIDSYYCVDELSEEDSYTTRIDIVTESYINEVVDQEFYKYKAKHGKEYANNEHQMRKKIFEKNFRLVKSTNDKNLGYKLALNEFSDRTEEEMKMYKGLRKRRAIEEEVSAYEIPYNLTDYEIMSYAIKIPMYFDLRFKGYLSPTRVQGACGACWAFATTAVVEGALARANKTLFRLSEQAILDCAWGFGGLGCEGGDDTDSYKWIAKHGLPTEEDYGPYMMQDGYCRISEMDYLHKIKGYVNVKPYNVEALKVAVAHHGPVSVSLHISEAFHHYREGIFYDPDCSNKTVDLDHEVAVVGYGGSRYNEYWIIRNSWGPHWGIDGYMYISTMDNNCGITNSPTYVLV